MSALIDIIAGAVVGAIFLIIAINTTNNGTQNLLNFNAAKTAQEDLVFTAQIIERDVRKIGFGIPESQKNQVLLSAQANHLKFLAHLNQSPGTSLSQPGLSTFDNVADTIEYTVTLDSIFNFGDTTVSLYQVNRTVKISGVTPQTSIIGRVGNMEIFKYQDQLGNQTSYNPAVRMLEVSLAGFNPNVMLSPEHVLQGVLNSQDIVVRKREIRRILRGSYRKKIRLVLHNLRN